MAQEALLPAAFAVHCFTCPKVIRSFSSADAHDLMEQHYRDKHAALIHRLTSMWVPR
jgi:hypothetical protein